MGKERWKDMANPWDSIRVLADGLGSTRCIASCDAEEGK